MVGQAAVVEASGLVKSFGRTQALDGLDLSVTEGEVHGFLGPNGAGKSTTLRVLLGLIRPTAGAVRVLGRDPWAEPVAVHRDIAYVPGDVNLWPNLTGGEVVDLLTGLRGGAEAGLRNRLLEEFELEPRRRVRTYSKGNRQKVALVAAFARRARLYLLDEPSAGLDPLMDAVFRAQVRRVRDEGATVLISSHILSEVEQLCSAVTIIRAGRAVESGSLAALRHLRRTHFRVTFADPAAAVLPEGVHDARRGNGTVEFDADAAQLPGVLAQLARPEVASVEAAPPSLESLFLRHYGGDDGDGGGGR